MSTTTQIPTRTTPSAPTPAAERQPVWKHGVASAVVASVATTVLAAIASAAGVVCRQHRREHPDRRVRAADAGLLARLRRHRRRHGAQGTSAAGHVRADGGRPDRAVLRPGSHVRVRRGSAATLITLHTVAAAIVVPTLGRRLARADQARTVPLSFRQVDAISPTPLRGNPGCGGEDAHEGTEGQVAALARGARGRGAPTGHDDEQHPAIFAFKVGQQARVAATRSAHMARSGDLTCRGADQCHGGGAARPRGDSAAGDAVPLVGPSCVGMATSRDKGRRAEGVVTRRGALAHRR